MNKGSYTQAMVFSYDGCNPLNYRMICLFPRQTIQYHSNPSLSLTSNAEEAEIERFYEDLQDLLELKPKKMSFSL